MSFKRVFVIFVTILLTSGCAAPPYYSVAFGSGVEYFDPHQRYPQNHDGSLKMETIGPGGWLELTWANKTPLIIAHEQCVYSYKFPKPKAI